LRDVRHMCRIICYHTWFRTILRDEKRQDDDKQRLIRFKLLKTSLKFAFGEKKILGIAITMNFLDEYERFQAKHIIRGCQRLVSHIRMVPHSFFYYENPS